MRETMETDVISLAFSRHPRVLGCTKYVQPSLLFVLFPKSVSLTHLYFVLLLVYYFIVVYTNT